MPLTPIPAHPRDWPIALGIGLLWLFSHLPLRLQQALGRVLGRTLGRLSRRRRRIGAINLALCFPELDERERARLLRAQLESVGMGLFETALAWWGTERRIHAIGEVEGLDHLRRARDSGQGILLLTGHFTTLELGARLLVPHCRFHAMHRPHRNAFYHAVMTRCRERHSGLPTIDQEDIRLVESVHRGLKSRGYRPGPLVLDPACGLNSEHSIRKLQQWMREGVDG